MRFKCEMEQIADSNSSSESSLCSETALNEFGGDENDEGVVAQQGIFANQRKPLASDPDGEGDEDMDADDPGGLLSAALEARFLGPVYTVSVQLLHRNRCYGSSAFTLLRCRSCTR